MRRRSLAFIAAVSTIALTQIASAADLPRKAPAYTPPPPPAVYNWTGFYIGVNGGYGWNAGSGNVTAADLFTSDGVVPATSSLDPKGGFGGGQIGYNFQAGQVVWGIEADIQGAGINRDSTAIAPQGPNNPCCDGPVTATATSKLDWFGTVRGRLGYAFDRWLPYITGGFAFGGVKDSLNLFEMSEGVCCGVPPLGGTATHNKTATGYVLGGGLEYAFSPAWSLKGEYQYLHLGTSNLSVTDTSDCCDRPTGTANFKNNYNTVRIGLNYRFGAPY